MCAYFDRSVSVFGGGRVVHFEKSFPRSFGRKAFVFAPIQSIAYYFVGFHIRKIFGYVEQLRFENAGFGKLRRPHEFVRRIASHARSRKPARRARRKIWEEGFSFAVFHFAAPLFKLSPAGHQAFVLGVDFLHADVDCFELVEIRHHKILVFELCGKLGAFGFQRLYF